MTARIRIHVWKEEGQTKLTKKAARNLLGIQRRDRFNEHCKALGLFKKQVYTFADLSEILALDLYLRAKYGKHSRESYAKLKRQPNLLKLTFAQLNISVENELRRILTNEHRTSDTATTL